MRKPRKPEVLHLLTELAETIPKSKYQSSNGLSFLSFGICTSTFARISKFDTLRLYFPNASSFFPASGKKSGDPNLSTPKVLMMSWVSLATMKSAKAFAPAAIDLWPFRRIHLDDMVDVQKDGIPFDQNIQPEIFL